MGTALPISPPFFEVKSQRNNKPLNLLSAGLGPVGKAAKATRVTKIQPHTPASSTQGLCLSREQPPAPPSPPSLLPVQSQPQALASCLFLIILSSFLELVLEGTRQLVEESHLLTVLQEPSRGWSLIWFGLEHQELLRESPKDPILPTPVLHWEPWGTCVSPWGQQVTVWNGDSHFLLVLFLWCL